MTRKHFAFTVSVGFELACAADVLAITSYVIWRSIDRASLNDWLYGSHPSFLIWSVHDYIDWVVFGAVCTPLLGILGGWKRMIAPIAFTITHIILALLVDINFHIGPGII